MKNWTISLCLLARCGPTILPPPAAPESASRAFNDPAEGRFGAKRLKRGAEAPAQPYRSIAGDISPEAFAVVNAAFEVGGHDLVRIWDAAK